MEPKNGGEGELDRGGSGRQMGLYVCVCVSGSGGGCVCGDRGEGSVSAARSDNSKRIRPGTPPLCVRAASGRWPL